MTAREKCQLRSGPRFSPLNTCVPQRCAYTGCYRHLPCGVGPSKGGEMGLRAALNLLTPLGLWEEGGKIWLA